MTPPPHPPCGPEPGLFWDGMQCSVAPFTFPTYHIPTYPSCLPFATFAPLSVADDQHRQHPQHLSPFCSTNLSNRRRCRLVQTTEEPAPCLADSCARRSIVSVHPIYLPSYTTTRLPTRTSTDAAPERTRTREHSTQLRLLPTTDMLADNWRRVMRDRRTRLREADEEGILL